MDDKIMQTAQRIRTMREILEFSVEEMAIATNITPSEYEELEQGQKDFTFSFLHNVCAKFNVELLELLTGETGKLSFYAITRNEKGPEIIRRIGLHYRDLCGNLKGRKAQPFLINAPYSEVEQIAQIPLNNHDGQEFDYILEGSLKVSMEGKTEILNAGDCIMYEAAHMHGMVATNGKDCKFLAIIFD